MTLEESIKILNLYEHAASSIERDTFLKALWLGIEALKRERINRDDPDCVMVGQLLGETEE